MISPPPPLAPSSSGATRESACGSVCTPSFARAAQVVYVDSGSTDGSVELAAEPGRRGRRARPVDPLHRRAGAQRRVGRLLRVAPDLGLVQFVDGDCEVVAGWTDVAVAAAWPSVPSWLSSAAAAASGTREASIYNQLCDIEWDTPVGDAEACAGATP